MGFVKKCFILALYSVTVFVVIRYTRFLSGIAGDIGESAATFRKLTYSDEADMPFVIRQMHRLTTTFCYYLVYMMIQQAVCGQWQKNNIMFIICVILLTIQQMYRGSRFEVMTIMFSGIHFYFVQKKRISGAVKISFKVLMKMGAMAMIVFFLFGSMRTFFGREGENTVLFHLAHYAGTSIFNFDYCVQHVRTPFRLFGHTFRGIRRTLAQYFGIGAIPEAHTTELNYFMTINGASTGNTYTSFYTFYQDWNVAGIFLLSMLTAFIHTSLYRYSCSHKDSRFTRAMTCLYGNSSNCVLLVLYGNPFLSMIAGGMLLSLLLFMLIDFIANTKFVLISRKKGRSSGKVLTE